MKVELKYLRFANPNDAIFKTDLARLKCNASSFIENCVIVNIVHGIVVILVEIYKTNVFSTTKYLMSLYPLANG